MSLEKSPTRAHRRFGRIPVATTESGLSRSALYGLATKHKGLFKKAGSATIVDLNMLADIIAELPDADINISASKPAPKRKNLDIDAFRAGPKPCDRRTDSWEQPRGAVSAGSKPKACSSVLPANRASGGPEEGV